MRAAPRPCSSSDSPEGRRSGLADRGGRDGRVPGSQTSRPGPPRRSRTLLVMDQFHDVRRAGNALDVCRRRIQQDAMAHRGMKGDPALHSQTACTPAPACSPTGRSSAWTQYSPLSSASRSKRPGHRDRRHHQRRTYPATRDPQARPDREQRAADILALDAARTKQ